MSLDKFLAAGRSFAGCRDEKSPYEMRKNARLPRFDGTPRFARRQPAGPSMEQTDWLQPRKEPLRLPGAAPAMNPPSERMVSKATRSWLAFFTFGLLGKRKRAGTLVQAEMTLEKVQVIRNDLSDSDLELVVRKRKAPPVPEPPAEPAGSPGRDRQRWNERTARLFALSNP